MILNQTLKKNKMNIIEDNAYNYSKEYKMTIVLTKMKIEKVLQLIKKVNK